MAKIITIIDLLLLPHDVLVLERQDEGARQPDLDDMT